jgi:hypothetical protein
MASSEIIALNVKASSLAGSLPTVSSAITATVPDRGAISKMLGRKATKALIGQAAVTSAGITGRSLETAKIIKPGSGALVDARVKSGMTLREALSPNLFTGKPGAASLIEIEDNIPAQVDMQRVNFQTAQTELTELGVITGSEDPTQISGQIFAASIVGSNVVATALSTGVADTETTTSVAVGNFAVGIVTDITPTPNHSLDYFEAKILYPAGDPRIVAAKAALR